MSVEDTVLGNDAKLEIDGDSRIEEIAKDGRYANFRFRTLR